MADRVFEAGGHQRRDRRRAQVHQQPGRPVAQRRQHRCEDVFFLQTGTRQFLFLRVFLQHVHHLVDGDPADQAALFVHDRRRDQVVTFEGVGGIDVGVHRVQAEDLGLHDGVDQCFGFADQQARQRQGAAQLVGAVHHEDLVGMVGQFVQPAQVAQHDFQGDVFAHPHHVEVHDGAHGVFRVAHGGDQLRAFRVGQAFLDLGNDIGGQIRRQIGDLVGVHGAGGRDQVLVIHGLDQRFPRPVLDFQEHVGVVFLADQLPDGLACLDGQRFQDEGDVGRMQRVDDLADLDFVLTLQHAFKHAGDLFILVRVLALGERVHDLLAFQDVLQFLQGQLGVFRVQATRDDDRDGGFGDVGLIGHQGGFLRLGAAGGCGGFRRWPHRSAWLR